MKIVNDIIKIFKNTAREIMEEIDDRNENGVTVILTGYETGKAYFFIGESIFQEGKFSNKLCIISPELKERAKVANKTLKTFVAAVLLDNKNEVII